MICDTCIWNDGGDCLCGHEIVPFDCVDYEDENDLGESE